MKKRLIFLAQYSLATLCILMNKFSTALYKSANKKLKLVIEELNTTKYADRDRKMIRRLDKASHRQAKTGELLRKGAKKVYKFSRL